MSPPLSWARLEPDRNRLRNPAPTLGALHAPALASVDHDIARPLIVGDRVDILDRPEVSDCRKQNTAFGDFAYARVGTSACSGRCRGAQRFGLARRRGFAKHVVLTNDVLDRHALTESPAADFLWERWVGRRSIRRAALSQAAQHSNASGRAQPAQARPRSRARCRPAR